MIKTGFIINSNNESKIWLDERGYLHRTDGPAVEWEDGRTEWYLNDKLHREDGPAIEWPDGSKFWYFNGKQLDPLLLFLIQGTQKD